MAQVTNKEKQGVDEKSTDSGCNVSGIFESEEGSVKSIVMKMIILLIESSNIIYILRQLF